MKPSTYLRGKKWLKYEFSRVENGKEIGCCISTAISRGLENRDWSIQDRFFTEFFNLFKCGPITFNEQKCKSKKQAIETLKKIENFLGIK